MSREARVLALIETIYAAAEEPRHWSRVLDAIADATHSGMTVLFYQDVERLDAAVVATTRIEEADVRRYARYYAGRNPYFTEGKNLIRTAALIDDTMYDQSVLKNSEYYQDYLLPLAAEHTIAAVLTYDATRAGVLSTFRSSRVGTYDAEEHDVMRRLQPHLARAFHIHERLFGPATRADFSAEALDLIPTGVFLLDGCERVVHINARAQAMLDEQDGLTVRERRLRLASAAADGRLERLIHGAASRFATSTESEAAVLLAERPSGRRAYSIVVAPLVHAGGAPAGGVAVLVVDTERRAAREGILRSLYNLTPTESRVALALLNGGTLATIADEFGVTLETARTHLKRIFDKTATRRQSELLRLLTTAAGILDDSR